MTETCNRTRVRRARFTVCVYTTSLAPSQKRARVDVNAFDLMPKNEKLFLGILGGLEPILKVVVQIARIRQDILKSDPIRLVVPGEAYDEHRRFW